MPLLSRCGKPLALCYSLIEVKYRGLDPLLGVFTGVLAYYLYETNLRTAPAHEDTLGELFRWKRGKWRRAQAESEAAAPGLPEVCQVAPCIRDPDRLKASLIQQAGDLK
jgi:hypothetical protein